MKVKDIRIQNFKRFTDLTIEGIPETAKMFVLVGPNGCGKTSVFEAFNLYYKINTLTKKKKENHDLEYYYKGDDEDVNIDGLVDIQFYDYELQKPLETNRMFFRTAYRNDPDLYFYGLSSDDAHINVRQDITFRENEEKVSQNYARLIFKTMNGIYETGNDEKTIKQLRNELIRRLRKSVKSVFSNLTLNEISSPLDDQGSFYFKKGNVDHYHYKNLSSGERAAFDLLLDFVVNEEIYKDSLVFIDEIETHIHTKLQGKVVEEIYNLIPDNSQLWITTHSLGVMTKAKELSIQYPGSVVFFDFDGHDFDQPVMIIPSSIDQVMYQKFLSVALDGLEEKIAPRIIVLCEGSLEGKESNYNFDAEIYNGIFKEKYPYITFISRGCKSELKSDDDKAYLILSLVFEKQSKVYRLVDRDDSSDGEVENLRKRGIFTISQRNIEGYLFSEELIKKLVLSEEKEELVADAMEIRNKALQNNLKREKPKPSDDLKSAAREIRVELKNLLGLTRCGEQTSAFMKNTMLPLITPETEVYKEMEREIIHPILEKAGIKDMSKH